MKTNNNVNNTNSQTSTTAVTFEHGVIRVGETKIVVPYVVDSKEEAISGLRLRILTTPIPRRLRSDEVNKILSDIETYLDENYKDMNHDGRTLFYNTSKLTEQQVVDYYREQIAARYAYLVEKH